MEDDTSVAHAPTLNEVPPADSIGRHLCEVACSCGLFRTTALGRDAESARADALHSFDAHLARADHPAAPANRPQLKVVPAAPPSVPEPPRPRRRVALPLAAVLAVGAALVGVLAVIGGVALVGNRNEYAGAPTLVGGPDRRGPATFATTTARPTEAAHSVERGDRYDDLRAGSPEVKLWSDDRIDQVSRQICGLVRAGRSATETADVLTARGVHADRGTLVALQDFAERFAC